MANAAKCKSRQSQIHGETMATKTYGPYRTNEGRLIVIHYDSEARTRKTQSYPRFLMEKHLGRLLLEEEHVDHRDGDFTNNDIANLQILTQLDNNRKAVIEGGRQEKRYYFKCPVCNKDASVPYRQYRSNQLRQRKAGPYCSTSCAGKRHH
jgi:hypothetical protein